MDVTGIVNIQCSHIFVKSSVDLQLGEKYVPLSALGSFIDRTRFANTDYALLHALQHTGREASSDSPHPDNAKFIKHCDHEFSYDISCGYCVNAVQRFESNPYLRDEAPFVKNLCYLIPLVHVQNHKDNCTYLYSLAYVEHAGHDSFLWRNC